MENVITEKRPQRYADLLMDWTFKRVFGENGDKRLIISLLNSLLGLDITDVTYLQTEHTRETSDGKSHVIDLRCECSDGKHIIVEVQRYWQEDFYQRCVAYVTTEYQNRGRKGKGYGSDVLLPVYLLAILSEQATAGHRMHQPQYDDRVLYHYRLQEKDSGELISDTINVIFAELEKFRKDERDCESMEDRWLYVLKNMRRLEALPPDFRQEVFRYLFEAVDITKFTPTEMDAYQRQQFAEWDEYNIMKSAKNYGMELGLKEGLEKGLEEGREQGLEQGLEQGRADRNMEIARNLKSLGVDDTVIMQATGLTEKQIAEL